MKRTDLRLVAGLVAALAAGAALLAVRTGHWSPSDPQESPHATAEQLARAATARFLDRYVDADGRVVRHDQGGDTVSEGQAYALLLAAAVGDRRRFDLVDRWTAQHLRRGDGLLSSRWSDGRVRDPEPATDADLDAARALLVAGTRFHDPAHTRAGVALGEAILAHETTATGILVAGPWAATSVPYAVNPSYFSPRAFAAVGAATGDARWSALAQTSRRIVDRLTRDPASLPPNWAASDAAGRIWPTGPPGDVRATPQYAFDAVRVPLRMAEDCDPTGRRLAARARPLLGNQVRSRLAARSQLDGRPLAGGEHPGAAVGAAAAARAAGARAESEALLRRAAALDVAHPTYYGAALVALGRVLLSTTLLGACSGSASFTEP